MANEISVSGSISCNKNGLTISAAISLLNDMSGSESLGDTQTIGTTAEAISVGDISTIGYVFLKNTDSTNYVEISLNSNGSSPFSKILPGEFALFPAATATMYAIANTASIPLQKVILEL